MANWCDNVPAPMDADGCVVPLDTKVLYDSNGNKVDITSFTFRCDAHGCWAYWEVFSPDARSEDGMLYVDGLHLAPPDSWERLEEDARKAPREYIEGRGIIVGSGGRVAAMARDLVRRAKALAERDAKWAER